MYFLHPGVDDWHVSSPASPRTALVITAIAAHPAVVAGGVEGSPRGGGPRGALARAGVAHVQGRGAQGQGGGLGGRRGDGGAAAVGTQLGRRVAAVRQRVRNWGGNGSDSGASAGASGVSGASGASGGTGGTGAW